MCDKYLRQQESYIQKDICEIYFTAMLAIQK